MVQLRVGGREWDTGVRVHARKGVHVGPPAVQAACNTTCQKERDAGPALLAFLQQTPSRAISLTRICRVVSALSLTPSSLAAARRVLNACSRCGARRQEGMKGGQAEGVRERGVVRCGSCACCLLARCRSWGLL